MKNEIDARAAEWVARQDAGPLTREEEAALDTWLSADSRHLGAYARMQAIMLRCERLYRGEEPAPATPRRPLAARGTWRGNRRFAAIAATVALACALSLYVVDRNAGVHSTRLGEIAHVALDDGSVITMNTSSRVRVSFDDTHRNIELLRGEAMFDVAKDGRRPFVVTAGDTRVTAVGTSFRVRKAPAEVSVLVREGIVDVREGPAPPIQLVAGNKAVVAERSDAVVREVDDEQINRELAWRNGMIAFGGETMEEVAGEFARYSAIRIRIGDPEVAGLRVVGLFSATDPIGFSRAAARSMNLDAVQGDGEIVLHSRGPEKNR